MKGVAAVGEDPVEITASEFSASSSSETSWWKASVGGRISQPPGSEGDSPRGAGAAMPAPAMASAASGYGRDGRSPSGSSSPFIGAGTRAA